MATLTVSSITSTGCVLTLSDLSVYPSWAHGDRTCYWYIGTNSYVGSGTPYTTTTIKQTSSSSTLVIGTLEPGTTYYVICKVYGDNNDDGSNELLATIPSSPIEFTTIVDSYSVTCYFNDSHIQTTRINGVAYSYNDSYYFNASQTGSVTFQAVPKSGSKFLYWQCTIGGVQRIIYENPFIYPDDLGETAQDISLRAVGEDGSSSTTWTTQDAIKSNVGTTGFNIILSAYELYRCAIVFNSTGTVTLSGSGGRHAIFLTDNSDWSDYDGTPSNNNGIYETSGYDTSTTLEYDVTAGTRYYLWVRYYNPANYGTISVSIISSGSSGGGGESTDLTDKITNQGSAQHSGRMAFYVRIGVNNIYDIIGCSYKIRIYNTSSEAQNSTNLSDDTGAIQIIEGIINEDGLDNVVINYTSNRAEIHNIEVDEYKTYYCRVFIFNDFSHDSVYISRKIVAPDTAPADWDWSDVQPGVAVNTVLYTRWNDFCDRISQWLAYKNMTAYAPIITSYGEATSLQKLMSEAKMTGTDKTLTAKRFNIAKMCIYQMNGGTSIEGFVPVYRGDPVYASYFAALAMDINNIPE